MTYGNTLALRLLWAKVGLWLAILPLAAWAQTVSPKVNSPLELPWTAWAFIAAFAIGGWVVADLDKVAELWNLEGKSPFEKVKARFVLVKAIVASLLAGISTYFVGKVVPGFLLTMMGMAPAPGSPTPEIPEMLLFLAVTSAGYMGARWWDMLEKRMFKS